MQDLASLRYEPDIVECFPDEAIPSHTRRLLALKTSRPQGFALPLGSAYRGVTTSALYEAISCLAGESLSHIFTDEVENASAGRAPASHTIPVYLQDIVQTLLYHPESLTGLERHYF